MSEQRTEPELMFKKDEGGNGPWKVEVDVYLKPPGSDPAFYLESCLPMQPDGTITFYNRGRQGFEISYILHDELNPGYSFPNPPKQPQRPLEWALWSRMGQGCPPPDYGQQWDEFTSVSVKDQGKTLVVRNTNSAQNLFGYTLRVRNDVDGSFLDLDPGGNNQNGSTASSSNS